MFTMDTILFISFIISISSEISQAFPDGATNSPDSEQDCSSTREVHMHKHHHRPMVSTTQGHSSSGGRIIFPEDTDSSRLTSRVSPDQAPICSDPTFCENVPNYPEEFIMNILQSRRNEFKHLATVDPPFDFGQRVGVSEYETLCDTEVGIVYPKAAKTTKDEWLFIVNTKYNEDNEVNFQQGFRVERCINPNSTCKIVDHAAASSGYDTECKQQHILRSVLGVKNGELAEGSIMLPVSCCCQLKYRGDVFSRIAGTDGESVTSRKATSSRRH